MKFLNMSLVYSTYYSKHYCEITTKPFCVCKRLRRKNIQILEFLNFSFTTGFSVPSRYFPLEGVQLNVVVVKQPKCKQGKE